MSAPYGTISILETIQAGAAQALASFPAIASLNIPILTEFVGDVVFTLQQALLGGATVAIVVHTPSARAGRKNMRAVYWEKIEVRATVCEAVTQNQYTTGISAGTGTSCLAICEFINAAWQQQPPTGQTETLVPDQITISPPSHEGLVDAEGTVIFPNSIMRDVSFYTQAGLNPVLPTFDALTFTQVGASLTISAPKVSGVAIPGAAVFYTSTTNGSTPLTPSPLAQTSPQTANNFYTGAITVATGQKIRAAAWLPGYLTGSPGIGFPVFTCS